MRQPAPDIAIWLTEYNKKLRQLQANGFEASPQNTREGLARLTSSMTRWIPPLDLIVDSEIEGPARITLRIYHPDRGHALPVLIYCHGGGHMAGSIDTYDPICRKLAKASRHVVISIEYRLAPEHPYPAGLDDASCVIKHYRSILERHNLPFCEQLSLGGDSGGGAMCASLSHAFRNDPKVRILNQILIYPSLDYSMQLPSVTENGEGYFLHKDKMVWLFDNYFQNNENRLERSPLHMGLDGHIPATLVATAEFCPLRDEGIAYADRMEESGITVERLHFDDMIHAFLNMEDIASDACAQLYRKAGEFLNRDRA